MLCSIDIEFDRAIAIKGIAARKSHLTLDLLIGTIGHIHQNFAARDRDNTAAAAVDCFLRPRRRIAVARIFIHVDAPFFMLGHFGDLLGVGGSA
jgi:hypothetical protein